MTPAEAQRIVTSHFKANQVGAAGLDARGLATALVAGEQVDFEFDAQTGQLRTSALIYRWRDWVVPGLLEALRAEAAPGGSDTGGGVLRYVPSRKTLSLSRTYPAAPAAADFESEQQRLRGACAQWRAEVFARVAEGVRHPEGT